MWSCMNKEDKVMMSIGAVMLSVGLGLTAIFFSWKYALVGAVLFAAILAIGCESAGPKDDYW